VEESSEFRVDNLEGKIEFEQVVFSYPTRPELQVLKDLSFYVNPGEKIALAGHSGAGKSTIIQLLLKFYEVHQGEIKIDGQNLNRWNLEQLRSHIGMVPQEVLLFGGSIRENIAYAKPNASEEEIIMAAKK
ncbi:MAG TPA: multidrug ABC transporter ATP-binding protein, partial [Algoriphagus sp.]|nr:multidrug ABC transporter ATP-binding protein [Algoriphagus sp.]